MSEGDVAAGEVAAGEVAAGDAAPGAGDHRGLTSLQGLAALSLDALSSVAYGPESIVLVLAAAGTSGLKATLPITIGIASLLAVLTISYRQVIAVHPDGGGAYAVSAAHLGPRVARVAAASLIIDYVLTVAVSITAGIAALTSAFPAVGGHPVLLCLVVLVLLTAINLVGLAESAKVLMGPTVLFIVGILGVVVVGLIRSHPAVRDHGATLVTSSVKGIGLILVAKAFAAGCTSLTGVEAIANAVPTFRDSKVARAQRTEVMLGALLGLMLLGLAVLVGKFSLQPRSGVTLLDQMTAASYGHTLPYYVLGLTTTAILAFAANTSFGGLPVLLSLLARDHLMPHWFGLRGEKPVYRTGITVLAVFAAALIIAVGGNTQSLIPLFAIGVFIGFTLSQAGLVRYWWTTRPAGWLGKAFLNGLGSILSGIAAVVFLASKFVSGAWLVPVIVVALVALFSRVRRYYDRVGRALHLGDIPPSPRAQSAQVIVPVGGVNEMTSAALSAALSMGGRVLALSVQHDEKGAQQLRDAWADWACNVELDVIVTDSRTLVDPVVKFVCAQVALGGQVTVLIPQVEPRHVRYQVLQNQRGFILANQLRTRTDATVATYPFRIGD